MNLQLPDGTARRSPGGWWSLAPPSHPCLALQPWAVVFFCLNPAVANSFHFQKWNALRCPDFPLAAVAPPAADRGTAFKRKGRKKNVIAEICQWKNGGLTLCRQRIGFGLLRCEPPVWRSLGME